MKVTIESIYEMAQTLCTAGGIAGRESHAITAVADYLAPLGEVHITPNHSVWCTVCPGQPGGMHLVLEAHLDRIGLMVTHLEENGFLRIANVGGFDRRLLPAAPVTVHAQGGDYSGVIASVPPHLAGSDDKPLKMEDFLVDTGYSTEKARELFAPGDLVSLDSRFVRLAHNRFAGAALDDRIGCAAVIAAGQLLAGADTRCRVTLLLASQEEVGGVGAKTAAFVLQPDIGIAVDVSFAAGFGAPAHKCGKLGEGPMLGYAPILNHGMTHQLAAIATRNDIKIQHEVMGGSTGTDADGMVTAGPGVRMALLSIPQRNMHTTVETCQLEDVLDVARLMAAYAKEVG